MTPAAYKLIKEIEKGFGEAYFVGGCVRDTILDRNFKDIDLASPAKPLELKDYFKSKEDYRVIPTGEKHGTVTVVTEGESFEVTTYRSDTNHDGRHADVQFASSIEEDLARRDFTMNAIARSSEGKLIDPYDGLKDINSSLIRAVGDPDERFKEDHLRILRAVRFLVQLNFTIEEKTSKALKANKHMITLISKERIRDELNKILMSNKPSIGFYMLIMYDLLDIIIPEFKLMMDHPGGQHHAETVDDHTFMCLRASEYFPADLNLRLAVLLHDISKPICYRKNDKGEYCFKDHDRTGAVWTRDILTRLKYSNEEINEASKLVELHLALNSEVSKKTIRRFAGQHSFDFLKKLNALRYIDSRGNRAKHDKVAEITQAYELMNQMILEVEAEKSALTVKDLAISGYDLMALGFIGKDIGDTQRWLLEKVTEFPELNTKEKLIHIIKSGSM